MRSRPPLVTEVPNRIQKGTHRRWTRDQHRQQLELTERLMLAMADEGQCRRALNEQARTEFGTPYGIGPKYAAKLRAQVANEWAEQRKARSAHEREQLQRTAERTVADLASDVQKLRQQGKLQTAAKVASVRLKHLDFIATITGMKVVHVDVQHTLNVDGALLSAIAELTDDQKHDLLSEQRELEQLAAVGRLKLAQDAGVQDAEFEPAE